MEVKKEFCVIPFGTIRTYCTQIIRGKILINVMTYNIEGQTTVNSRKKKKATEWLPSKCSRVTKVQLSI